MTELTKTVRAREPSSQALYNLYTLFRLHFTPERSDFLNPKREARESAVDIWKRILEVEKYSEFQTMTAADFLA